MKPRKKQRHCPLEAYKYENGGKTNLFLKKGITILPYRGFYDYDLPPLGMELIPDLTFLVLTGKSPRGAWKSSMLAHNRAKEKRREEK